MHLTQTSWTVRPWLAGVVLFALLGSNGDVFAAQAPVVYVAPIEGMIDLGLAPFVPPQNEAAQEDAAAVILAIILSAVESM